MGDLNYGVVKQVLTQALRGQATASCPTCGAAVAKPAAPKVSRRYSGVGKGGTILTADKRETLG